MPDPLTSFTTVRVRYGETDQMGTFYNARALDWFECGRTAWLHEAGLDYRQLEQQGIHLPVIEAHVRFLGRAGFDDTLRVATTASSVGRARLRFDVEITHDATNAPVAAGYTIHPTTTREGKPIRPPAWLMNHLPPRSPGPAD